jgi:hypothetical protein
MLATTEQYLKQLIDFDTASPTQSKDFHSAWQRKNRFWGELESLLYKGEHFASIYVGFAAANTVTTALNDERFHPLNIEDHLLDDDLDPYQWDASFYAAGAYAGGFTWEEGSSVVRRREFWEWYLDEAVPLAWNSVS